MMEYDDEALDRLSDISLNRMNNEIVGEHFQLQEPRESQDRLSFQ